MATSSMSTMSNWLSGSSIDKKVWFTLFRFQFNFFCECKLNELVFMFVCRSRSSPIISGLNFKLQILSHSLSLSLFSLSLSSLTVSSLSISSLSLSHTRTHTHNHTLSLNHTYSHFFTCSERRWKVFVRSTFFYFNFEHDNTNTKLQSHSRRNVRSLQPTKFSKNFLEKITLNENSNWFDFLFKLGFFFFRLTKSGYNLPI